LLKNRPAETDSEVWLIKGEN